MVSSGSGIASVRFSTEDFPERERASAWREFFGREVCRLDIEPLADRPFRSSATLRALPDLHLLQADCPGAHYQIAKERIDSDDLALVTCGSRAWVTSQIGREAVLRYGDASLMTNGEPGWLRTVVSSPHAQCRTVRLTCVRVPRRVLAPLVTDLDVASVRPILARNEALRLLMSYLRLFERPNAVTTPELGRLAASHVHDLLAMAIGATNDAREIALGRGMRAARLHQIKTDILANLNQQLNASALAARHGVSERYVHKLFEMEGITLSQFVLARRLARVHRMLSDPRFASHTITAIALDAGFGDISTFNRDFRRYGATPSDVRAASCGHKD